MSLSKDDVMKLEKIANALDKTGQEDKMVIADTIDAFLKEQAALKKIAIEIFHPKLLAWLSSNYPKAFQSAGEAGRALKELLGMGSGDIEGVGLQDLNNLRNELKKRISPDPPGGPSSGDSYQIG